jgi:hypothetical protein
VLYAYIIKIILVWELPNGGLTYMICGFGIIGIITHFLAYPLSNHDSKLLKLFCRYFYHSLAIPVSVLFLAIIVRVNEYGITEERYLVTIIAIWFAASCSYVILHQAQKLKLVPIIVAALFIFSSFGPWSASRVSGSSQVERLKELLIKEKLLQNGKIIKTTQAKSFEYNKKVSYIISYLVATKKIDLIQNWFPRHNNIGGIDNECKKHSHFEHRWQDEYYYVQILMQDMGLQYVDFWQNEETPKSVEFSMKNAPDFYDSINEVKGFDYVANFNLDSRKGAFRKIKTPSHDFKLLTFINGDKLIVSDRDKNGIEFDLQQLMEQLKNAPDQEDNFIAYGENKKFHVKLYFTYIKATDSRNFNEKNYSINCVMLIKMLK